MVDEDKREEVTMQRVKRDATTGMVLIEHYVSLKSTKKSIEELQNIAKDALEEKSVN